VLLVISFLGWLRNQSAPYWEASGMGSGSMFTLACLAALTLTILKLFAEMVEKQETYEISWATCKSVEKQ
jgi:hypothetical protein